MNARVRAGLEAARAAVAADERDQLEVAVQLYEDAIEAFTGGVEGKRCVNVP